MKNLLENARDSAPETQQNIKIAFAEGYLAAKTDNKENTSGPGKVMKVFILKVQCCEWFQMIKMVFLWFTSDFVDIRDYIDDSYFGRFSIHDGQAGIDI